MVAVRARAVSGAGRRFEPVTIQRREPGPHDVLIDIAYAGICHTDVHHARAEFGTSYYPMVPGHEIAGHVSEIGAAVTRFAVGDRIGVGCMVDSCRSCSQCLAGLEQYCRVAKVLTYNAIDRNGEVTLGGYSEKIVVDEAFAVTIPETIPLERAAPLMCAGITTYSPLKHWSVGPGTRLAIVGFGGLGHVGVQIGSALGATVTAIGLTDDHAQAAHDLGAADYRVVRTDADFERLVDAFDVVVSTVSLGKDLDSYMNMLAMDGTLVNLGVPEVPLSLDAYSLFRNRRSLAGSLIGGIAETQEMVDFCGAHGIGAVVEVIEADAIDDAFDRVTAGEARYRVVIDNASI